MVHKSDDNLKNSWILDSASSYHICSKREWFDTYEKSDGDSMVLVNDDEVKVAGIGTVKLKLHNGTMKMLSEVRHIPKLEKILISLGRLDSRGYGYSSRDRVMRVT